MNELHTYAPQQLEGSNERIINLWLSRKSAKTQKAYRTDISQFLAAVNDKPLGQITLPDLIDYQNSLGTTYAMATQARKIGAIRSLLAFGYKAGFLMVNVGAAADVPKVPNELAQRILSETEVIRMIDQTDKYRNKVLIHFAYSTALRAEEISTLKWKHITTNGETGQLTIHGKGDKTRFIKLSESAWKLMMEYKESCSRIEPEDPVFLSQKGNAISTSQIWRIVKGIAKKTEINPDASPHWLRHAHASHSLDRGGGVHLVQAQLGHVSLATTSKYVHAKPKDTSGNYLPV